MRARVGLLLALSLLALPCAAAPERPRVGIWITDIYDLDANNRTFSVKFWIWSVVPSGSKLKPLDTFTILHARQFTKSRSSSTETAGQIWSAADVTAVIRHDWDVREFPFDAHKLEIVIEDSEDEDSALQYAVDARQSGVQGDSLPRSWHLEGFTLLTRGHAYGTTFGDPALQVPHSRWSQLVARIHIERDAVGVFTKMLLGAYVAALLALLSFRIKTDQPTLFSARLALLVGSLFATVVNLRSTEAVIGRSDHFTLVDKIHVLIAVYILLGAIAALTSRRDFDREQLQRAIRRDRILIVAFAVSFVIINVALIWHAAIS